MKLEDARDQIDIFYAPPMSALSDCLRGFLCAKAGYDLIAVDFAQIEARMIAWLASEETALAVFRAGKDIYIHAAASIFGVPPEEITPEERTVGKVAVLALGFQGGYGAFQVMAKAYNVRMAPAYWHLWEAAGHERRERIQARWKTDGKKACLYREEWIASELTKLAWRDANPNIVDYWRIAENAAQSAVQNPGKLFTAGQTERAVKYRTSGSFLWCQLPSKRVLCYPYPHLEEVKTPWGAYKTTLTYMAENSLTRQWERHKAYGGLLVENITQAASRDLLTAAMVRCETRGYSVVAHIHDEIVSEVPVDFGSLQEMEAIMTELPRWAAQLPMAASGWRGKRYRK